MTDILAIPAEFDTISVGYLAPGTSQVYEKCLLPRPPHGPFTHHAVRTFAKTCSEGRIGLNWRNHLLRARETWKGLTPEELSTLSQAAKRDRQRYAKQEKLEGRGAKELLHLLQEKKLRAKGVAPSAFDAFKNSPETRSRLFEAKEGPVDHNEFYDDKVFIWLWGRIGDEEKGHWRKEAKRFLDITNTARRIKGEEDLILDTEPQPPEESPSPGKRTRLGSKTRPPKEGVVVAEDDDDGDNEDDHDDGDDDHEQEPQSTDAQVDPVDDVLQWRPTEDENLTLDEKQLLESIPPDLRRWDRCPRAARNAYTVYYADRLTTAGSPHIGEDPHCSTTRAKIHADWEAADDEHRQHFEDLAKTDKEEFNRQSNEYHEWQRAWSDGKKVLLLRKVINRWRPHSSFDDGQNRLPAPIPRRPPCTERTSPRPPPHRNMEPPSSRPPPLAGPAVDYRLPSRYYPVIRTDYSNGAVYRHLRHVLMNSELEGDNISSEVTFYDGEPSQSFSVEELERGTFAEDDPRARDYDWCKTNLENKSLDDIKAEFGELAFHRKKHVPIYTFGGHSYAIVIDSRSMKDGTVMFVSLSSYDFLDIRREDDPGQDGAWEQDEKKAWYLAPRVQAADVMLQLANLDIANMDWDDFVQHRVDHGLDLFSDPKAQQWRGWQWAIECVFGDQALENVVGAIETTPYEAYVSDMED